MNRTALILFFIGLDAAQLVAAEAPPQYYVPIVAVKVAGNTNRLGHYITTWWWSSLSAYNGGSNIGTFTYRAVYGEGAVLLTPGSGCVSSYPMTPNHGFPFESFGGCVTKPVNGPGFLAFDASPGMVASASVRRVLINETCNAPYDPIRASQGSAPLPIFRGLFAAGSSATSGEITLGAPRLFAGPESCFSANQKYPRRVNMTLFNGGDVEATFVITARLNGPDPAIFETSVTLASKEVRQLDNLAVPAIVNDYQDSDYGVHVWLTTTATQPFLCYASSIFEDGEPGSMPFAVFPGMQGIP